MPKVSVIIPCYNQGIYINEAVDSVLQQTLQDFEIIIVNDGSTDEFTNTLLESYNKPKTKVIHTENRGPSAARNSGIQASSGKYILPLDGDDLIGETYLEKAADVLNKNPSIGIVYCLAEKFGKTEGLWELEEYSLERILVKNMIFCTAMFRKSDFERTEGYNENMRKGDEDWDFWISLLELDIQVYQIPEVLFYYRILHNSRSSQIQDNDWEAIHQQLYKNHLNFYMNTLGSPIKVYQQNEQLEIEKTLLNQKLKEYENLKVMKVMRFFWKLKK